MCKTYSKHILWLLANGIGNQASVAIDAQRWCVIKYYPQVVPIILHIATDTLDRFPSDGFGIAYKHVHRANNVR